MHIFLLLCLFIYSSVANAIFNEAIRVKDEAKLENFEIANETNDMYYHISELRPTKIKWKKLIFIKGWAFIDKYDAKGQKVFVALKSDKKTYFFDTKLETRHDVAESLEGKGINLENAGFTATIARDILENGTYNLGISILNNEKKSFVLSDKYFDKTDGNFEETLLSSDLNITFGIYGNAYLYKKSGFGYPETNRTLSEGKSSVLSIPTNRFHSSAKLETTIIPLTAAGKLDKQTMNIYANDKYVGKWEASSKGTYSVVIPKEYISDSELFDLRFDFPNAASPVKLGIEPTQIGLLSDKHLVAVFFKSIRLSNLILPTYKYNSEISFGINGNASNYQFMGWAPPEQGFTWTEGENTNLMFHADKAETDIVFSATVSPLIALNKLNKQIANIYVNDKYIDKWEISSGKTYSAIIPKEYINDSELFDLRLNLPNATSPVELGISNDGRKLALAISKAVLWAPPTYKYNSEISFGINGNASNYQFMGWAPPEQGFTWVEGKKANIIAAVEQPKSDIVLKMNLAPFTIPDKLKSQSLNITINKTYRDKLKINAPGEYKITIPKKYINDQINITFETPDASSPASLKISGDTRILGIAFYSISLTKN